MTAIRAVARVTVDVPLRELRWRCVNCRGRLTDFVMTGVGVSPCRAQPDPRCSADERAQRGR